jgi:D-inositol-3-phosphate glycosyltransferase
MSRAVLEDLNQFTDNKNKLFLPHPIYNIFGNSVSKEAALQTLGWNAEDKHVLFFGLVRKYKGLDLLLEAMGDPRLAEMNVKVIVAGEFYDDEKIYHDQIDKLGIKDRVILRNEYIPAEEVKNYFCASDLIAQTYRTATQSGVTQIAYHFERPMLVTDVGGLAEIVPDGKVGYATAVDPKAIADALVDFYENAREQQFTANTVLEKERFTWTKFVDGVTELYQTIQNS